MTYLVQGIDVGDLPYTNVNPAISRPDQPRMLLTYAQTAFVLAEHYAASGDHVTAETHYNECCYIRNESMGFMGSKLCFTQC